MEPTLRAKLTARVAVIGLACIVLIATPARSADEIHWTITGQTSVGFDWRGADNTLRYGTTAAYGQTATASTPNPLPYSSAGPFWEARLTGLAGNTVYHYSIGSDPDHTFRTPPPRGSADFTIMAQGDIGSTSAYSLVAGVQSDIAAEQPAFTLCVGDLTYGNANGQAVVDEHFNDVMVWSRDAAYMPAWGNHEWDSAGDDLSNYKGRFNLPNPRSAVGAPAAGGAGKDWYWFDYGNVRFIAYPEPYSGAWADWYPRAIAIMDSAQSDPAITFIVTFGHRPAYSSAHHPGDAGLQSHLDAMGATHSKYVLNINGHSHNYERTTPQGGVIHLTVGTGGSSMEEDVNGPCLYLGGCPPPVWSAFRAYHRGALRLRFTATGIEGAMICGPARPTGSNADDVTCTRGDIMDSFTIGSLTSDRAPVVTAPQSAAVAENSVLAVSVTASDPDGGAISTLTADLSQLPAGNNAVFTAGSGRTSGTLTWKPTFSDSGSYTVSFTASNALAGSASTVLHVSNVDRAPILTAPLAAVGSASGTITYSVTATDPDNDAIASLTADFSELPAGNTATFTPAPGNHSGIVTWTPSVSDSGFYNVSVTASNALTATASTALNVRVPDLPPSVNAPAQVSAFENTAFTIDVSASDPDHGPIMSLSADLSSLPIGNTASFSAGPGNTSGVLTWTPTYEDSGTYVVRWIAANTLADTATTLIHVADVNPQHPASSRLLGMQPNPTAGAFSVQCYLTRSGPARIELVDLFGRRVQVFQTGVLGAGTQQVECRPDARLASGPYFVRLTHDGTSSALKVVLRR